MKDNFRKSIPENGLPKREFEFHKVFYGNKEGIFKVSVVNKGKNLEFKLELFFDFDEKNNDDVQTTLHVYKNGIKQGAYFGTLEEMYNLITKTYAVAEPKSFFSYTYIPVPLVEQPYSVLALSHAINPEKSFPISYEG